jgi:hypothetical protein
MNKKDIERALKLRKSNLKKIGLKKELKKWSLI